VEKSVKKSRRPQKRAKLPHVESKGLSWTITRNLGDQVKKKLRREKRPFGIILPEFDRQDSSSWDAIRKTGVARGDSLTIGGNSPARSTLLKCCARKERSQKGSIFWPEAQLEAIKKILWGRTGGRGSEPSIGENERNVLISHSRPEVKSRG